MRARAIARSLLLVGCAGTLTLLADCTGSPGPASPRPPEDGTNAGGSHEAAHGDAPTTPTTTTPTTPTTTTPTTPTTPTTTKTTETAATAPLGPAIAHAPPANLPLTMLPGVLVDRPTHTVYLMRETSQVEAIDIPTGKTRWIVKHAERPLALSGTHLLAQSGTSLVVLDARTGKLAKKCKPAAGTTWLPPPIQARLGWQASLEAKPTAADQVLLLWSIDTHYAGGAAPPPEVERRARTHTEGMVDVDVAKCTFAARAATTVPRVPPGPSLPTSETRRGSSVTHTQVLAAQIVDGPDVRVILESTDGQSRLLLHRTAPPPSGASPSGASPSGVSAPLADVELATGPAPYVRGWLSTDARHTIAVVQDRASGTNGAFQYDHTIHDALTGDKVGAFRVPWHAGGVLVVGDALFEVTSAAVRGVDLQSGKQRWTRGLRSLSYNGPMPP